MQDIGGQSPPKEPEIITNCKTVVPGLKRHKNKYKIIESSAALLLASSE